MKQKAQPRLIVVIINGYAGAGKDTFVECIRKHTERILVNIHSSDPAKTALKGMGWNGDKADEVRALLVDLIKRTNDLFGTAMKFSLEHYNALSEVCRASGRNGILFIHERDPGNIEKLVDTIPMTPWTVFVERNVTHVPNNPVDRNVERYDYDIRIRNSGTLKDLEVLAIAFMEFLEGRIEKEGGNEIWESFMRTR